VAEKELPRMTRWPFMVVAMLYCLLAPMASVYAEDAPWLLYRNDQDGFELRFPPTFVAGTYKSALPASLVRELREAGSREPFEDAIVLAERARVGLRDLSAMSPGEITAVTIEVLPGPAATSRMDLGRQIYGAEVVEVTIGSHRVHRFPGFPGPHGVGAFYYLVPLRNDAALEFTAHRKFLEPPLGDTGYERVIEQIIGTLRLFPRP
jgi:hypothetical protein